MDQIEITIEQLRKLICQLPPARQWYAEFRYRPFVLTILGEPTNAPFAPVTSSPITEIMFLVDDTGRELEWKPNVDLIIKAKEA